MIRAVLTTSPTEERNVNIRQKEPCVGGCLTQVTVIGFDAVRVITFCWESEYEATMRRSRGSSRDPVVAGA